MERRKFKDKVDILEDSDAREEIAYCRHCMINFNLKHQLYERKDYDERDADLWLQCWECWRIYPKYEVKYEGRLRGLIDADVEGPMSSVPKVVGFDNKHKQEKKTDRLRRRIKEEHDPEVRQLLKQGIEIEDDYKWNYQE